MYRSQRHIYNNVVPSLGQQARVQQHDPPSLKGPVEPEESAMQQPNCPEIQASKQGPPLWAHKHLFIE